MTLRRRAALASLAAVALIAGDLLVFVLPPADPVQRTDLVVVLGPPQHGDRLRRAVDFARRHPGTALLVSTNNVEADCDYWRDTSGFAALTCYRPDPFTTRGEARGAAEFAKTHGYRSMTVATTPEQLVRAGVRFRRCFPGKVQLLRADLPWTQRIRALPYQNAAMVKALVFQRSC